MRRQGKDDAGAQERRVRPGGTLRSFLVTSWGGLFLEGRLAIHTHPVILIAPAVCVALLGVAFAFLGDSLRDILDPHMRELA